MSGRYATVLFSIVYLAGIVAALYQLVLGTAAKAFPRWLSGWLSMRKQLGLIALMVAIQHFIVCCFLPVPGSMIDSGLKKTSTKMNR
jgi:DMSO/TMAO reductase YedYZ heme-binding membrane subunit